MRGDKMGSPVLSTYTFGGAASSSRRAEGARSFGETVALPVVAFLGAATVAAIVSVSFEGKAPTVIGQKAGLGDPVSASPLPELFASAPKSNVPPDPGSSPMLAEVVGGQSGEPATASRQELPFLTVLRPNAAEPAAQRVPDVRGEPISRGAGSLRSELAQPTAAPSMLARECAADCLADPALASTPGFERGAAGPNETLVANIGPARDDLGVDLVAQANGDGLLADRTVALAADLEPVGTPLADSQQMALVEPQGGQISATPDGLAPERPLVEPSGVTEGLANSPPLDVNEAAAEAPATDVTAADPGDTAREAPIPYHLARIGERYSSAPVSEPPPSAQDRRAASESASILVTAEPGVAAAAVGVEVASQSTVIIQDNELVAIKLGELVSLLEDRLDHPLYVWMKSSAAASKFVTAETLAAAGIRTRYDAARKQIVLSTTGE